MRKLTITLLIRVVELLITRNKKRDEHASLKASKFIRGVEVIGTRPNDR